MTKETFEKFINAAKAKGIKNYAIRCQGGNRIVYHNDTTGKIILLDDEIISVTLSKNYASPVQSFVISAITYDCIDDVLLNDIPFAESIEILKGLNVWNDELKEFFSKTPNKKDIVPGTAGIDIIRDKDGKEVIGKGSSGYVTK